MRSRLDAAIRRFNAQNNKLNQTKRQCSELADQLKHAQVTTADLESQANTVEERIKHIREQMNTVTNNKEYSAFLIEVNTFKLEKTKLEDEALAQMTHVEELQEQFTELQEKQASQESDVAIARKVVSDSRQEVGDELDKRTAERDAAAAGIPSDALEMMKRLADGYDGQSMAKLVIEGARVKEYRCGGCYMGLPLERANQLMTNVDKPVTCPSCSRILYLEENAESTAGD